MTAGLSVGKGLGNMSMSDWADSQLAGVRGLSEAGGTTVAWEYKEANDAIRSNEAGEKRRDTASAAASPGSVPGMLTMPAPVGTSPHIATFVRAIASGLSRRNDAAAECHPCRAGATALLLHAARFCWTAERGAAPGEVETDGDERAIVAKGGRVPRASDVSDASPTSVASALLVTAEPSGNAPAIHPAILDAVQAQRPAASVSPLRAGALAAPTERQAVSGDAQSSPSIELSACLDARLARAHPTAHIPLAAAPFAPPLAAASLAAAEPDRDVAVIRDALVHEVESHRPAPALPLSTGAMVAPTEVRAVSGDAGIIDAQALPSILVSACHDASVASSRPAAPIALAPEPLAHGKSEPSQHPYVLLPNARDLFAGVRIRVLPHAFGMALTFECGSLEQRKQIDRLGGRLASAITRRARLQVSVNAKQMWDDVEERSES